MNTENNPVDIWNETIKIRDTTIDIDIKKRCHSLLSAMNTAGGMTITRPEVERFISDYYEQQRNLVQ
jgi:hypothetical protein